MGIFVHYVSIFNVAFLHSLLTNRSTAMDDNSPQYGHEYEDPHRSQDNAFQTGINQQLSFASLWHERQQSATSRAASSTHSSSRPGSSLSHREPQLIRSSRMGKPYSRDRSPDSVSYPVSQLHSGQPEHGQWQSATSRPASTHSPSRPGSSLSHRLEPQLISSSQTDFPFTLAQPHRSQERSPGFSPTEQQPAYIGQEHSLGSSNPLSHHSSRDAVLPQRLYRNSSTFSYSPPTSFSGGASRESLVDKTARNQYAELHHMSVPDLLWIPSIANLSEENRQICEENHRLEKQLADMIDNMSVMRQMFQSRYVSINWKNLIGYNMPTALDHQVPVVMKVWLTLRRHPFRQAQKHLLETHQCAQKTSL